MRDDVVMKLLREVKAGKVSVEDARDALSEVELSEDAYQNAVDHGVFNEPEPGTIIRASISPSGESWLVIIFAMWGILWTLYWAGTLSYGRQVLRPLQSLGPTASILPSCNDSTNSDFDGYSLLEICNA